MIKNLTILGGGTSGLISALILKAKFNSLNIDVIKSSEIGIIGVGEGSTEHWSTFMKICGISINELIKETDATFKTGIKFVNWNGDNDYYFHSLHSAFGHEAPTGFPFIYSHMIANGYNHHDVIPKNIHESTHTEYFETSVNQFHFNTFKLNEYLLKLCRLKSINIIDAKIDEVIVDDTGHVSYLLDEFKKKYVVNISPPELCCSLSHEFIWKKIIAENNKYGIVLEDDVLLSKHLKNFISMIETSKKRLKNSVTRS
jgi:tryptophan halogenase